MVVCPLPFPLHRCVDKARGLLSSQSLPVTVFHTPATDHSSAFERSDVPVLLLLPQSPPDRKSDCLVTPRRCLPSAADEEWYSPKMLPSTVIESNYVVV